MLICLCLLLIAACSRGEGETGSLPVGNVAFSLVTAQSGGDGEGLSARAASIDCVEYGIAFVEAQVLSDDGESLLAQGGPWECSSGQGTISGVSVGINRRVVVQLFDQEGGVRLQGSKSGITILPGLTTDVGTITVAAVEEIDPIVYVDPEGGAPQNSGRSWNEALSGLQAAIDRAQEDDEIWVKAGTYPVAETIVVRQRVTILGGFSGTETAREERDWHANTTTFDGNDARRCFLVLCDAMLDGLTVKNGTFSGGTGGGVACEGTPPQPIEVLLENCTLTGNSAEEGGGVAGRYATLSLTNCVIVGNKAAGGGGVAGDSSALSLINCVIPDNTAGEGTGGGVLLREGRLDIVNTSFYGNAACGGGAVGVLAGHASITNSILWGDRGGSQDPEISVGDKADVVVTACDVMGGFEGQDNICAPPAYVKPAFGDLRLQAWSPCLDAGRSEGAPSQDIEGRARPAGPGYDLGAYEGRYDNRPPQLSLSDAYSLVVGDCVSVNPGDELRLTLEVQDPDGDEVHCSAADLPLNQGEVVFSPDTGVFTWQTHLKTSPGSYTVLFSAADDGVPRMGAWREVEIVVGDGVNRPPRLESLGTREMAGGAAFEMYLMASDPEGDEFAFALGEVYRDPDVLPYPEGASLGANGVFTWNGAQSAADGNYFVCCSVSDGDGGEDFEDVRLSVGDVNRPPGLDPLGGERVVHPGGTLRIDVTARDPEGDTLFFGVQDPGGDCPYPEGASFNKDTQIFTWQADDGPCCRSVRFSVSDGQGYDAQTVMIRVQ